MINPSMETSGKRKVCRGYFIPQHPLISFLKSWAKLNKEQLMKDNYFDPKLLNRWFPFALSRPVPF
jgi:hypothetical protein